MKAASFEEMVENNPLRSLVREKVEIKGLLSMADSGTVDRALHLPCGDGSSTMLVARHLPSRP